jgi:cytochrome c55X
MRLKRSLPNLLLIAFTIIVSGLAIADITPERQAELIYLLRHDCGSCHGMRLEGGLGPALKPERFRHWSTETLAMTILYGRSGTPMPPWGPFITEPEALWLAGQLKKGIQP